MIYKLFAAVSFCNICDCLCVSALGDNKVKVLFLKQLSNLVIMPLQWSDTFSGYHTHTEKYCMHKQIFYTSRMRPKKSYLGILFCNFYSLGVKNRAYRQIQAVRS